MKNKQLVFNVAEEETGQRLDIFLTNHLIDRSRGEIQKDIETGRVFIQEKVSLKPKKPVRTGDVVTLDDLNRVTSPQPEKHDLSIIYDDESMVVINKPVGMIVHPNHPEESGTLVQALLERYSKLSEAIYDPSSSISRLRPGIVHRLDKDTSGIIVVAKTTEALQNLAKQFHDHTVEKEYRALVEGMVAEPQTIKTMVKRSTMKAKNLMKVSEEGRIAITHVTPLHYYLMPNGHHATLLRCTIETGRTHQIRVHCKHITHPILGDQLYNSKSSQESSKKLGITRQLLHASSLTFHHPISHQKVTFEAPLPEDFTMTLTRLIAL